MQSNIIFKVFFLFLLLMVDLFAVEGNVKLFIKEHKTLYTSQKITVSVVLMTDAFSTSDARINFPSSQNYIVQEPKSAAFLNQEEIDGVAWQQVHYEYDVYALQAGKVEIPPMNISFSGSMGYGQEKKAFEFKSEVLSFQVEAPEGIESNRFVLVTDKYTLESVLKPKKKTLIVGDAVELTVLQKAQDVPDILFTPIVYKSGSFLRVYDKEPELKSGLKGDYDVSRTDSFTFVATAEGNVTIPSKEIVWWSSKTKKVQKESIPAMTFKIIADPQIALDAEKAKEKKWLVIAVLIVLIFLLLWYFFTPVIRRYVAKQKSLYAQSEKGKFDKLLKSIEEEGTGEIYKDFYDWINTFDSEEKIETFRDIYIHYPKYKEAFLAFETALVFTDDFDNRRLKEMLLSLRENLLEESDTERFSLSKKLNP